MSNAHNISCITTTTGLTQCAWCFPWPQTSLRTPITPQLPWTPPPSSSQGALTWKPWPRAWQALHQCLCDTLHQGRHCTAHCSRSNTRISSQALHTHTQQMRSSRQYVQTPIAEMVYCKHPSHVPAMQWTHHHGQMSVQGHFGHALTKHLPYHMLRPIHRHNKSCTVCVHTDQLPKTSHNAFHFHTPWLAALTSSVPFC
ncbi:hypothetical protein COO60DRAFT_1169630 [Scenedesmus sp. NREL 46B-D3]|nr:hypothetical protein COO60DRAFT_1169630 [Scenedesmus sp. NREL 46B-D3]